MRTSHFFGNSHPLLVAFMSIAIARVEGKVFNTNTHEFSSSVRKKKAVQYRKQHQTGMK